MEDFDRSMIEAITKKVIAEYMASNQETIRSVDPSGIIAVRAEEIAPEPFDTGKSGDQVWLKDIFSLEESPRMGAGIMAMDSTVFEWTLNYDEVDYIIEGTLEIIIDGRTTVGNAGDVILIPRGSKIQFSSPDKCRFLYVVYPANWADQG